MTGSKGFARWLADHSRSVRERGAEEARVETGSRSASQSARRRREDKARLGVVEEDEEVSEQEDDNGEGL